MGSEVRRAAAALVAVREERFETQRPAGEARERLERALDGMHFARVRIESEWTDAGGHPVLVVKLLPLPAMQRLLSTGSMALVALMAASVWVVASEGTPRTAAFLIPMTTLFAIFALPLAAAALGSQREGEEARLRKAIRSALAPEGG